MERQRGKRYTLALCDSCVSLLPISLSAPLFHFLFSRIFCLSLSLSSSFSVCSSFGLRLLLTRLSSVAPLSFVVCVCLCCLFRSLFLSRSRARALAPFPVSRAKPACFSSHALVLLLPFPVSRAKPASYASSPPFPLRSNCAYQRVSLLLIFLRPLF